MIVYHGSNVIVERSVLLTPKRTLVGFCFF